MSDDSELVAEMWAGEAYALRTFRAEGGRLVSVSAGGGHWEDGVCIATCLRESEHVPPAPKCDCGAYAFWTLTELRAQYREFASRMVAAIRMDGARIQAENGLKSARAQIVAWWCAEDAAELVEACLASIPPLREGDDGDVVVRRFFDLDVMVGTFPPPPAAERNRTERD